MKFLQILKIQHPRTYFTNFFIPFFRPATSEPRNQ